jgi:hypothetical protein
VGALTAPRHPGGALRGGADHAGQRLAGSSARTRRVRTTVAENMWPTMKVELIGWPTTTFVTVSGRADAGLPLP